MNKTYGKIAGCLMAIVLAGLGSAPLAADGAGQIATVKITSGQIDWSPLVENNGFTLVVSGPGIDLRREYGLGEALSLLPIDDRGNPLPDGTYNWELRVVGRLSRTDGNGMNNGRPGDDEPAERGALVPSPSRRLLQSGTVTILNGAIIDPQVTEPKPAPSRQTPGRTAAGSGADATDADLGGGLEKDQVFIDDGIFVGSICVGQDCVNGEAFGFDTLRLKENNLRIKFQDTSNSASFPTNDWQLTANDSSNGGADKFSIDDITGGRTPFTIEAGAPSNSLVVEGSGEVGFGTANPVVELHVTDGDTPTLRLEQDGSSGFGQQTWDVAGNEAGFFVRDVTNGSKLAFRIQPNSPAESIFIKTDRVHIKGPIEPWQVVIYRASGLADTDDIDHVAEADFSMDVTQVSCTSDDATAVITMKKDGVAFASGCSCNGSACFSGAEAFGAGNKLDFQMDSANAAKRVSVHLKRSGK